MISLGVIAGLALGYAQGIVWRRRVRHTGLWVIANIPGPVAASLLIMVSLYVQTENTLRDYTTIAIALVTGLCTAVALLDLLRYPTLQAEWVNMFKARPERQPKIPAGKSAETVLGSTLYSSRSQSTTSPTSKESHD